MADKEEPHPCSAKELKAFARPIFAEHWEDYYPTIILKDYGYERVQCPKCGHNYWRCTPERKTCGDSNCETKYNFIGEGCGIGAKGKKITFQDAWNGFKDSFSQTTPPHTAIQRYPVVARWRDDVDFVAAGIYCFQPYCVSGELKPPANPLICPQFCLRFNDLDSIGISGRHYSGFVMIGVQSFYARDDNSYPRTRVIENHLNWLTKTLGIPKEEITFIEDVWAGGGNLGACVEFFVKGMEVGNMVFTDFKADMINKTWQPLTLRVVDVGIGLERIPFLVNGSATSYIDTFGPVLKYLEEKTGAKVDEEMWRKFGPYSCRLNIDECDDIEETWKEIAEHMGYSNVNEVRDVINIGRDLIMIADHMRTFLVAVEDGALPSSTGGGSNLRNLLRRVFAILHNRKWFDKIGGIDGLIEIMGIHREELRKLYGEFTTNPVMKTIVQKEYERWRSTDTEAEGHIRDFQKQRLKEIQKANKNKKDKEEGSSSSSSSSSGAGGKDKKGKSKEKEDVSKVILTVQDWIMLSTTYGVMPDQIERFTGQIIPQNYYIELAETKEKMTKQLQTGVNMYAQQCVGLPETKELLYSQRREDDDSVEKPMELEDISFDAKVVGVFVNNEDKKNNLIILNRTLFYPLSGGQDNDTGKLRIYFEEEEGEGGEKAPVCDVVTGVCSGGGENEGKLFNVVDVIKCGSVIAHKIEPALTEKEAAAINATRSDSSLPKIKAHGEVDKERRFQLSCHHTATHLIHSAAHRFLGPHIWQSSARKTVNGAHLDITHFSSISPQEVEEIQRIANEYISAKLPITKRHMSKEDAEKKYGFILYQGGVVPGKSVRVVSIGKKDEEVDIEACCGSHLDNTVDVQLIRITSTRRVSDGAVRLEFVAGPRARKSYEEQDKMLQQVCSSWSTTPSDFVSSANKFFKGYKDSLVILPKYQNELVKRAFCGPQGPFCIVYTQDFADPTWCISRCTACARKAIMTVNKEEGKSDSIVRIGERNRKWGVVIVGPSYLIGVLGWVPQAKNENKEKENDPVSVEDISIDGLKGIVDRANADDTDSKTSSSSSSSSSSSYSPSPSPSPQKPKKAAPLSVDIGKGKHEIPEKDNEPLPNWTVSLRCVSLRNAQKVVDWFVKCGFVPLDL